VLEQYRLGARFLPHLPDRLVDGGTRLLAGTLALRRGEQRLIVQRNLRRIGTVGEESSKGELQRAVRETFVAYGRYYVDCARLAAADPAEVEAGFTFEDYQHISDARRTGPGAILVLPHVGSWEWAGVEALRRGEQRRFGNGNLRRMGMVGEGSCRSELELAVGETVVA